MRKHLHREYEVYQRLPPAHERLIKMIDYSEDGTLILEYIPSGNVREYIESHKAEITPPQRLQWCIDAAEAVELVHSHDIIHCHIKPENFLLDPDLWLRLIDFSGSSIDGKPPHVLENTRFFLPRSRYDELPCLNNQFVIIKFNIGKWNSSVSLTLQPPNSESILRPYM